MSILAQRSHSASPRPADGVLTGSPRQVHGGGADDQGRAAPAPSDDHRSGRRADPWAQEPLGRLSSRGPRRPSHHPHVRQAVRPHRARPAEDRPSSDRRRRAQGGQLMRGAVYKRGSTWTWHFDIDPDPLTGRRRQRTKGGYKTRKAADQALAEAIGQWRAGRLPQRSTHTLSHFLQQEWLPAVQPRLRPSTWANYRTYTAAYVVPVLGQVKLQALTPVQLNHLYAHLLERGRRKTISRDRAGLAPKTVRNVHVMLHSALHDAMRWGYLVRNVAEAADPPAARSPEQRVWSPHELGTFLDHVRGDRLYALWLLVATTGMRRGELAGLRWVDIDFDHATVSPTIPRVVVDHQVHDSAPKTERARRRLALDPVTLAALQAHRQLQAEDRQTVGGRYRDHGYVFAWPDGRPLHPENIASWFEQHTRAAGLPRIRLHDVRHSYATAALKAGISAKVISERLGHASVAFTLQTYGHVIPGMDRDAAVTVADLILTSTQKGPGTVVPDPSANKTANNGPQNDSPMKEVKDERPAQ